MGSNEIYREKISGSLNLERETLHISDDTGRIALVDTKTYDGGVIGSPTNEIRYQIGNHLQSATLELDNSAAIISYEEFHAFGTSAYRLGRTSTEVSLKRYRYVGKECDNETGLYYYGARYYAAWLGKFISVDPKKDDYPMWSSFVYAGNMPVTMTDVNGEGPGGGDTTYDGGVLEGVVVEAQRPTYQEFLKSADKTLQTEEGIAFFVDAYNLDEKEAQALTLFSKSHILRMSIINQMWEKGELNLLSERSFESYYGAHFRELGESTAEEPHIIFESLVSAAFKTKVLEISKNLDVDPNHLMAIMAFETGETFDPKLKNKAGNESYGLLQFIAPALKDINRKFGTEYTLDAITQMSSVEQLTVVEQYIKFWQDTGKSFDTVSDFYMVVLQPKDVGKPEETPLFEMQFNTISDTTINKTTGDTIVTTKKVMKRSGKYFKNKGLDVNNDSTVTKKEAAGKVIEKLTSGKKFYNKK